MCVTNPSLEAPLYITAQRFTQEAIGFEFETGMAIAYDNRAVLVYQTVLYQQFDIDGGVLWEIIVDGVSEDGRSAVLEFRTAPYATYELVYACVMEIAMFAMRAKGLIEHAGNRLAFADLIDQIGDRRGLTVAAVGLTILSSDVNAAPQVTMGIAVFNIAQTLVSSQRFELYEFTFQEAYEARQAGRSYTPQRYTLGIDQRVLLGTTFSRPEIDGPIAALEWAGREVVKRGANPLNVFGSAGLLALVLSYLNAGWYIPGRLKYAKAGFQFMSRCYFSGILKALGKGAIFSIELAAGLFGLSDRQLLKARVFQNGFRAELGPLKGAKKAITGLKDWERISGNEETDFGPRIVDWLGSIIAPNSYKKFEETDKYDSSLALIPVTVDGRDLMCRGSVAYSSTSLAGRLPKTIGGIPFVIIEFREWPKISLAPSLWISLATRLYAFFSIHAGGCGDSPTPFVSDPKFIWPFGDLKMKRSNGFVSGFFYTPGNCLFDATSYQLHHELGVDLDAATLRRMTANEIRTNWQKYVNFVANSVSGGDNIKAEVERAAAYIEGDLNWEEDVADLAPVALAAALNTVTLLNTANRDVTIVVNQMDGTPAQPFGHGINIINLLYNGVDHYIPYH